MSVAFTWVVPDSGLLKCAAGCQAGCGLAECDGYQGGVHCLLCSACLQPLTARSTEAEGHAAGTGAGGMAAGHFQDHGRN